jgi:pimeloyl-ACP methyl ester carboxylesterase
MAEFSKKNISINSLTIHSEAFGNPAHPACILIACKRGTARLWSDIFCKKIADQGFFVIRYDHRDVGQSSEIDWQKAPYTLEDLAKDATLVLDDYGIKKAHIVGDSLGGWLCQWIGVDHPERILSLVIISAVPIEITEKTAIPLSKEEQEMMDTTSKMFITRKDGETLEETIQSYLPIWRYTNGDFPLDEKMAKDFTRDFLTRTKHKNAGKNHELMLSAFLATMKPLGILQKINQPTLVIHGNKDTIIPLRLGQAVAAAIPNSKFVMIPGMGHSFFNRVLEEKIAQLVVEHIKNILHE